MRLSLQVHYAICGIFDLAYNGHDIPVQVRVIGERQKIPTRYLEQIFQRLRRAELVQGKRGPGGGYVLARPPKEITLLDVVEAVEGSMDSAVGGLAGEGAEGGPESYRPDFLWRTLSERFAGVLGETSLDDLCRSAGETAVRRSDAESYTYQI
ncbi:MAG: Rrf2 family transcriptional regulator [Deltaproteobacteria bacterium]|nr:Rrf2 family transcriptional regulator [Deltaproteobacteria bacterium]